MSRHLQECDLLQAVEQAAFKYLAGYLINRVGKLLVKRFLAPLIVSIGGAFADGPQSIGDIIGLVAAIGITIRSIYDVFKMISIGLTQLEVPGLVVRRFIAVQTRNELRYYEPFA